MGRAAYIRVSHGRVKAMKRIIYWVPRICSFLFVVFLSLFAFDVFEGNQGWAIVIALFMHLLPALLLLTAAIVALKYELVGAIAFLGFAILFILTVGPGNGEALAFIAGPALLVGLLYLTSWIWHRRLPKS